MLLTPFFFLCRRLTIHQLKTALLSISMESRASLGQCRSHMRLPSRQRSLPDRARQPAHAKADRWSQGRPGCCLPVDRLTRNGARARGRSAGAPGMCTTASVTGGIHNRRRAWSGAPMLVWSTPRFASVPIPSGHSPHAPPPPPQPPPTLFIILPLPLFTDIRHGHATWLVSPRSPLLLVPLPSEKP